jgi:hypothetical protein
LWSWTPKHKWDLPEKYQAERARDVVQAVECLLGKHEALNSNVTITSPLKRKEKKRNNRIQRK